MADLNLKIGLLDNFAFQTRSVFEGTKLEKQKVKGKMKFPALNLELDTETLFDPRFNKENLTASFYPLKGLKTSASWLIFAGPAGIFSFESGVVSKLEWATDSGPTVRGGISWGASVDGNQVYPGLGIREGAVEIHNLSWGSADLSAQTKFALDAPGLKLIDLKAEVPLGTKLIVFGATRFQEGFNLDRSRFNLVYALKEIELGISGIYRGQYYHTDNLGAGSFTDRFLGLNSVALKAAIDLEKVNFKISAVYGPEFGDIDGDNHLEKLADLAYRKLVINLAGASDNASLNHSMFIKRGSVNQILKISKEMDSRIYGSEIYYIGGDLNKILFSIASRF